MSAPLLLLVSVVYLCVGVDQAMKGSPAGCLVWCSYAAANWGLMWLTK